MGVLADARAEAAFGFEVVIGLGVKMLIIGASTAVLVRPMVGTLSDFSIVALVEVKCKNILAPVLAALLE